MKSSSSSSIDAETLPFDDEEPFPAICSRQLFPATRFPPPVSRLTAVVLSRHFLLSTYKTPFRRRWISIAVWWWWSWGSVVEVKLLFVVLRWKRSTGSLVAAVRRSSFARTLQRYISAHILFFVGAPVVFVNIFRCQLISCVKMCSCSGNNPSYMWMSSI